MVELWLILALLAVAFKSGTYGLQNHFLNGGDSSAVLSHVTLVYGALFVTPIGLYVLITNSANLDPRIYGVVAALGVLEGIGMVVYLEAMNSCGISMASPLKKSNTVLIALLEPLLLGTVLEPVIAIGATAVGIGAFIVLSDKKGLSSVYNNLLRKGPILAFTAAIIYSFLSLGSRYGASNLSSLGYGAIIFLTASLTTYVILRTWFNETLSIRQYFSKKYLVMGSIGVARSVFTWGAYALASATLVASVTRLTILVDAFIGGKVFKEGNMVQKLVGSLFILIGVLTVIHVS